MDFATLIKSQVMASAIFDANNISMTISECANFLNKHRQTIQIQIHKGHIKAELIGNTYSIPKIQFLDKIIEDWQQQLSQQESDYKFLSAS